MYLADHLARCRHSKAAHWQTHASPVHPADHVGFRRRLVTCTPLTMLGSGVVEQLEQLIIVGIMFKHLLTIVVSR